MTLYLVRHGQTVWNLEKKVQGQHDSPLTPEGRLQASWLSEALCSIDFSAIYSSPSPRAYITAEIIRGQRNVSIVVDERLQEISQGSWEGKTREVLEQTYPIEFAAFWNTPHLYQPNNQGESFYTVQERVLPCIEEIIAAHVDQEILVVSHSATIKVILAYFEGRPLAELWRPPGIYPTSLCKVIIENAVPRIELYGDISHYRQF